MQEQDHKLEQEQEQENEKKMSSSYRIWWQGYLKLLILCQVGGILILHFLFPTKNKWQWDIELVLTFQCNLL